MVRQRANGSRIENHQQLTMSDLKKLIDYEPKFITIFRAMIAIETANMTVFSYRKAKADIIKRMKAEVDKFDNAKLNGTDIA